MKHAPVALHLVAMALLVLNAARAETPGNPPQMPLSGASMSSMLSMSLSQQPGHERSVPLPSEAPAAGAVRSTGVLSSVAAPSDGSSRRFDLSVNEAPAREVFMQMGVGTGYNVLVPPNLDGNISIALKGTTVPEALDILREMFGYDYRISGSTVMVYPNAVQTRLYRINYLPGRRQGASDLRVTSTSIANGGDASNTNNTNTSFNADGASGTNSKSQALAQVKTSSDADFWKEVQASLGIMVGTESGRSVVLNPAAGVIVVRATPAEHRHVGDYLRAVQISVERQVMLEAKIIEVQLRNESQTGVNWALFRGNGSSSRVGFSTAAPGVSLGGRDGTNSSSDVSVSPAALVTDALGKGFYGLTVQAANFSALLNFLQTQGDVQVLSSPRIATLNNQKAVLKVGSDELYVTNVTAVSTVNTSSNGTATTSAVPTVQLQPFFSGIVLDVTPQIDDAGAVILHVHPSISTVTEKKKNLSLGTQGEFNLPLPVSNINETDSIVRVRDGHIVAIGGLMSQSSAVDRSGVAGLEEVPVVGGLFRQKSTFGQKRELVVLIKPTVVSDDGSGWPQTHTPALAQ